jgi:peptide/nickel transport system permease protein
MGIVAVLYRNGLVDHFTRVLAFGLYSLPGFWLGMILQVTLAVGLGLFPVSGHISPYIPIQKITGIYTLDSLIEGNIVALGSTLTHLVLPSVTLGAILFPVTCRITRASLLDTLTEQYMVTARAKGLLERAATFKHGLPNAMLPIVTTVGMVFMDFIGGATSIEYVFNWPGMGYLFIRSALDGDFPLLEGVVLVYCLIVIVVSTLVDIIYSIVDPRVRLGE